MKGIKAWKSKTSIKNLGEKYVEEVTGQHIMNLWNNGPVHDEIIHHFCNNMDSLFYSEKNESFILLFLLIL